MRLAPGWAGGQGLVPVRKPAPGSSAAPLAAETASTAEASQAPKESSLEDDLRSLVIGNTASAEPSPATKAADDLGGSGILL